MLISLILFVICASENITLAEKLLNFHSKPDFDCGEHNVMMTFNRNFCDKYDHVKEYIDKQNKAEYCIFYDYNHRILKDRPFLLCDTMIICDYGIYDECNMNKSTMITCNNEITNNDTKYYESCKLSFHCINNKRIAIYFDLFINNGTHLVEIERFNTNNYIKENNIVKHDKSDSNWSFFFCIGFFGTALLVYIKNLRIKT